MLKLIAEYSIYLYIIYFIVSFFVIINIKKDERFKELCSFLTNAIQVLILLVWLPGQVNSLLSSNLSTKSSLLSPLLKINKEMFRRTYIVTRLNALGSKTVLDKEVMMLLKELSQDNGYYESMSKVLEIVPRADLSTKNKNSLEKYISYTDRLMMKTNLEHLKTSENFTCYYNKCKLGEFFKESQLLSLELKNETKGVSEFFKEINKEVFK